MGEQGWPERWNWKSLYVGTGTEIGALEITSGLQSVYPFNDALTDAKGSNNLSGTVTYADGYYGRSLDLTSQRAQASGQTIHEFGTSDFTICAWIYTDAVSGTQTIFAKRDSTGATNKGYRLYLNSSGKLVAEYCDGTASFLSITSSLTIEASKWYFVKLSLDRDGLMVLYINQSNSGGGSVVISGQQTTIATNGQTFTVGGDSQAGTNYWNGKIDQLEVFNVAVSDALGQEIFGNLHSMQRAACMNTSGNFVSGNFYHRNAENTRWQPESPFVGTGAQINSLATNLMTKAGLVAFCTSSGNGFIAGTYHHRDETDAAWTAGHNFTAQAEARYYDSDSSHYVGFKAGATITTNRIWTLPLVDGAAKEVLATDGAGVLAFAAPNMKLLNVADGSPNEIDVTASQTFTAADTIIKQHSLATNSFSRIFVMVYGRIDMGDDADLNNSISIIIKIGATTRTINHSWPDFVTGAFNNGEFKIPFFMAFSAVQTGAVTVSVNEDAGSDDAQQEVHIDGFYVFGMNF